MRTNENKLQPKDYSTYSPASSIVAIPSSDLRRLSYRLGTVLHERIQTGPGLRSPLVGRLVGRSVTRVLVAQEFRRGSPPQLPTLSWSLMDQDKEETPGGIHDRAAPLARNRVLSGQTEWPTEVMLRTSAVPQGHAPPGPSLRERCEAAFLAAHRQESEAARGAVGSMSSSHLRFASNSPASENSSRVSSPQTPTHEARSQISAGASFSSADTTQATEVQRLRRELEKSRQQQRDAELREEIRLEVRRDLEGQLQQLLGGLSSPARAISCHDEPGRAEAITSTAVAAAVQTAPDEHSAQATIVLREAQEQARQQQTATQATLTVQAEAMEEIRQELALQRQLLTSQPAEIGMAVKAAVQAAQDEAAIALRAVQEEARQQVEEMRLLLAQQATEIQTLKDVVGATRASAVAADAVVAGMAEESIPPEKAQSAAKPARVQQQEKRGGQVVSPVPRAKKENAAEATAAVAAAAAAAAAAREHKEMDEAAAAAGAAAAQVVAASLQKEKDETAAAEGAAAWLKLREEQEAADAAILAQQMAATAEQKRKQHEEEVAKMAVKQGDVEAAAKQRAASAELQQENEEAEAAAEAARLQKEKEEQAEQVRLEAARLQRAKEEAEAAAEAARLQKEKEEQAEQVR
eukprot:COSAG05_NODE_1888_length_3885_cov_17.913629_1_plen_635_part_10